MNKMISILKGSNTHYIKCIIPNTKKIAGVLDVPFVLDQMRSSGLLSLCRINKQGYPVTVAFDQFCQRYDFIYPAIRAENPPGRRGACQIMKQLNFSADSFKIGKNKLFFQKGKGLMSHGGAREPK